MAGGPHPFAYGGGAARSIIHGVDGVRVCARAPRGLGEFSRLHNIYERLDSTITNCVYDISRAKTKVRYRRKRKIV